MTIPDHNHLELETQVEELATAVMGPKQSTFAGGGRREEDGLVHKVEILVDKLSSTGNGVRVSLPAGAWVAIIVAIIAGVAQVAAAIAG